jgi:hypothetical protein
MFTFSNVKVYSAPISVGRLPASSEKFWVGAIFIYPAGSGL